MLINFPVNDIEVTATTIGNHWAVHPAILIDEDTKELSLDSETWCLEHRPSGKLAFQMFQSDPIEFPGEPRALDLSRVQAFVEWLESRIDCSTPDLDFSQLSEEDRRTVSEFRGDPNYFKAPESETTE